MCRTDALHAPEVGLRRSGESAADIVPPVRNSDGPYRGKRVLDLAILAIAGPPAIAIGAVCALAIRCTSSGPIFFRQERVGIGESTFQVWKFRTMIAGDNPIFPDANRITSAGKVLRRLSLDEVPQLINVALGEMSIVGPRPTLPYQVERYDDHQRRRLAVRPGLTGLAQVSGRNALAWSERIDFDVAYVETQSVSQDLRIILRTAAAILSGEGVEGHPTEDPLAAPPTQPDKP